MNVIVHIPVSKVSIANKTLTIVSTQFNSYRFNSYKCECQPGYTGHLCEIDIDECASSPCQYGKCWENSNPNGFIRRVERLSIPHKRAVNDTISQLDVSFEYRFNYQKADGYWCECTPGYTGTNCQTKINECQSDPCGSNGKCLDLVNEFKCECLSGFSGTQCQDNINECLQSPCAESTQCIDLKPDYKMNNYSRYHCDCSDLNRKLEILNQNKYISYTGENCTLKLNSCETQKDQCQHGSQCESILNDIKCLCQPGFSGKYCQYLTTIRLDGTYAPTIPLNESFQL